MSDSWVKENTKVEVAGNKIITTTGGSGDLYLPDGAKPKEIYSGGSRKLDEFMSDRHLPDETKTQQMQRLAWIRNNLEVDCPHCTERVSVCYHPGKELQGLSLCRNCGQAYVIDNKMVVFHRNGERITDSYPFPNF